MPLWNSQQMMLSAIFNTATIFAPAASFASMRSDASEEAIPSTTVEKKKKSYSESSAIQVAE